MEWSKVKNIIILLLLLVNGFLLVLVGMRREETENYQASALAQAVEVLERSGIQVFQEGLEDALDMSPLSVERNLERAEADRDSRGRLCAALGLTAGAFGAILLL